MSIETIINFINEYWGFFILAGMILDGVMGFLPDRWIPYIGVLRRVIHKLHGDPGAKNMLLVVTGVIALYGCRVSMPAERPLCERIPPDSYSVICQMSNALNTAPETISKMLQLANLAALEKDAYSAWEGMAFVKELREEVMRYQAIPEGLSYRQAAYIVKRYYGKLPKKVQAFFIIVGDVNLQIEGLENVKLSPYDFAMIRKHLDAQEAILGIYA